MTSSIGAIQKDIHIAYTNFIEATKRPFVISDGGYQASPTSYNE
jgi:hypothetical protein